MSKSTQPQREEAERHGDPLGDAERIMGEVSSKEDKASTSNQQQTEKE